MLAGIRVIEIEGIGPGPFAGMLLADMGADVIKVQRPGGPVSPGVPERAVIDRGKRSIVLDLKDETDRATCLELIATADALIEGFRPGVMERLGLGPDICHAANKALVYGRMTGWGQNGPMADRAGHDMNYIGLAGALWHASPPGQHPMVPATLIGDIGGGALYLAMGILAGILRARTNGQGTVIDAAIYDGAANMMNLLMTLAQSGGFTSERGQGLLDGPHWSRSYRTKDDKFMSVQSLEPKFYAIFLERLGLEDDPEFAEQFNKSTWPKLSQRLEKLFAGETQQHWCAIFDGSDACCAPVLTPEDALEHPINQARGVWQKIDGVLQAAPAPRFSDAPPWSPRQAPARGADSADIIEELAARKTAT
ncbi:MAG: CaiB/BaiF CoA transferase family protein [Arenibacterium sp.]